MMLRTLGGLTLEGSDFRRVKPLLLAAYLTLEGPKPRRYLSELFWPGASDAMNSLAVALSQLRRGAPGAVEADEVRAWSNLDSDAGALREKSAAGEYGAVAELYCGSFLEGLDLELGEELEEWLYESREALASVAREALLRTAQAQATRGDFELAGSLAERALRLPGAPAPEPEEFVRFHLLLAAGRNPALSELRKEAAGYGIELDIGTEAARARVAQVLLGRDRELERIAGMAEGQWAWVRGGSGMGKSALLQQLPGTYLPARAGLPYATLEPLLGNSLGESETVMLKRLAEGRGLWLFDDWEHCDAESRRLLARLRQLRPPARVVLASTEAPSLNVDVEIVLGPLSGDSLGEYPDAWEQTGGLPELVAALLRQDSVGVALERRLAQLGPTAKELYLALALAEGSELSPVRRALGATGAATGAALSELVGAGLVTPNGTVRARRSALAYLESRPALLGELAIRLAREQRGIAAFPLYQHSRAFWDDHDLEGVTAAYLAWAEELLRRGFARRSAEVLSQAPESTAVSLLYARALEQAGQYKEALERLETLPEEGMAAALKSGLYWRLGQPEEARRTAELALDGDTEARAEALNTLGVLARSSGDNEEAASFARRAAALWKTLGNQMRWVAALNNLGIARTLLGEPGEAAFSEALEASGDSALLRARTLLNLGWARENEGQLELAEETFRAAAMLAAEAGVTEVAAWAWNNLGVLHHRLAHEARAREAYEQALALAQRAGEQRILGMVMANLAELTENLEAWEEALRILEKSGHATIAQGVRAGLAPGHPFHRRLAERQGE